MLRLLFLVTSLLAGPLFAEETSSYNRVSFSVSANERINNDRLVIVMSVKQQGRDLQALARKVNKTMAQALVRANRVDGIEVQTLDYQTSPFYRKGKQDGWVVTQSLSLSGSDEEVLGKLMQKLQDRLQTRSVSYEVSPAARKQLNRKLTKEVLQLFRQRAQLIAGSLGSESYRLVEVGIQTGNSQPPVRQLYASKMIMADTVAESPVLQAGTQNVTVTARGVIEISP